MKRAGFPKKACTLAFSCPLRMRSGSLTLSDQIDHLLTHERRYVMRRFLPALLTSLVVWSSITPTLADEPKKDAADPQARLRAKEYRGKSTPSAEEAAIKPLPLEPFPDNPPPHEGAMIKVPYRLQPPDIILIEAIEAFPGRPITGEHLLKSDGKVSLGYYGEVEVAGLTCSQAKAKIILHLRQYIGDRSLGLVVFRQVGPVSPLEPPGTINPEFNLPFDDPALGELPQPLAAEANNPVRELLSPFSIKKPVTEINQNQAVHPQHEGNAVVPQLPNEPVARDKGSDLHNEEEKFITIAPEDSQYVLVDVAAYNSNVYYATGGFAKPGRLPWTGHETVLDAIQFAGGFMPGYKTVWLHRPARGGKPERSFRIDLDAIHRGKPTANLQILPGDRLMAYTPEEDKKVQADIAAEKSQPKNDRITPAAASRESRERRVTLRDRAGRRGTSLRQRSGRAALRPAP